MKKTRRQLLKDSLTAFLLVWHTNNAKGGSAKDPNWVPLNKTYTDLYGDHLNNVVVFGNPDNGSDFEAHVKMEFWGENYISIGEKGVKGGSSLKDGVITLDLAKRKFQWYKAAAPVGLGGKDGSLHWVEILKEKPASNKWSLKIADGGEFGYHYQTPFSDLLTKFPGSYIEYLAIDNVDYIRLVHPPGGPLIFDQRPLEVDGSYAVYHKTKENNVVGHKNYRTGKVLHIPRPKAVDSLGNRVWCSLSIKDGVYVRTIPQSFLDSAIYPVTINDTFGYATIGGTAAAAADDYVQCYGPHQAAAGGSATSVHIYQNRDNCPVTAGIYSDAADTPVNLLRDTAENTAMSNTWKQCNLDSAYTIASGTNYWIAVNHDYSPNASFYYDSVGGFDWVYDEDTYVAGSLENPFSETSRIEDRKYGIYVTYTPAAAGGGQIINVNIN